MHLHTDDVDVAHFCGALVNGSKPTKRNTELVLVRAGGNILVRVRIDIGIGTQGNRCAHAAPAGRACDPIDVLQLRFALDVETVNMLLERVFDSSRDLPTPAKVHFAGSPPAARTR